MNVARSTFVRRGYLLTALAVAVLLTGFSGTAWAQDIGVGLTMRASSSTLEEGAGATASTPDRVAVTITRTDPTYDPTPGGVTTDNRTFVFNDANTVPLRLTAICNGVPTVDNDDCSFSVALKSAPATALTGLGTEAGASLSFVDADTNTSGSPLEKTIELLISDTSDEDDWNEETIVLTLELPPATVAITTTASDGTETSGTRDLKAAPQKLTLTITDDDPMPTLKFAPPSIQLAKGNMQTMRVGVGIGAGGRGPLPTAASGADSIRGKLFGFDGGSGRAGSSDEILLSVSPPEAVGRLITLYKVKADIDQDRGTDLDVDREGLYVVGKIGGGTTAAVHDANTEPMDEGIALTIEAIDVSGFRDEQITFTLMDGRTEAQKTGDGGGINDSDPSTVTILSGEETPTVTFSKASVSIDEGDSETVHLLADSNQGDQVGSATVAVSGDARIALQQNGSAISGGSVSFDGSANAELTIRALGDESLEDGEEKTATVTITDASGANIGDPRAVTVTVVGSTAVPVLPLVGQLILALLLTAGGARLYRRRQ